MVRHFARTESGHHESSPDPSGCGEGRIFHLSFEENGLMFCLTNYHACYPCERLPSHLMSNRVPETWLKELNLFVSKECEEWVMGHDPLPKNGKATVPRDGCGPVDRQNPAEWQNWTGQSDIRLGEDTEAPGYRGAYGIPSEIFLRVARRCCNSYMTPASSPRSMRVASVSVADSMSHSA